MNTEPPASGLERRAIPREDTRRAARVHAPGRAAPLSGWVRDISPDGLRVALPHALAPGTLVQVAIAPRPEDPRADWLVAQAAVAWVLPEADGFAAGLRVEAPPGAAASSTVDWTGDRAEASGAPGPPPPADRPADGRRRRAPWAVIVIVAALALLWLGPCPPTPPMPAPEEQHALGESRTRHPAPDAATGALDDAWAHLALDNPDAALAALGPAAAPPAGPLGPALAALARAEALARLGAPPGDLSRAAGAIAADDDAPGPWRETARAYADALAARPDPREAPIGPLGAFRMVVPLEPKAPAPEAPSREPGETWPADERADETNAADARHHDADSPRLRLEIDPAAYTLTVFADARAIHVFPVGLGRDKTTPTGDFTIANKIPAPDWHHRGKTIPAGDPRNPLGDYWMGLGDERGPTPYGLHPTDESEAIGGNLSRGCIRMRPEDAAALFALVPVGTPVRILD